MKNIIPIICLIIITSCKIRQPESGYEGKYKYENLDKKHYYYLELRKDSTFTFKRSHAYHFSECTGKWIKKSNKTIFLTCDEEGLAGLSSIQYLNPREFEVKLINLNKLKYGKATMKRIKKKDTILTID